MAAQAERFREDLLPYLLNHLKTCRSKDVPLRAEAIQAAIDAESKNQFIEILHSRMTDLRPAQVKRLKRIIHSAEQQ
ncbi:hypothetical protein ACX8XP_11625 [Calditrichota bacterium LG25]